MFYTDLKPDISTMSAVDIVQFRTELTLDECQRVLDDLYTFYERLPREEVDQLLREHWNSSSINIMTKLAEIASHHHAKSYLEISLIRVQDYRLFSQAFIDEVVSLALQIARRVRNEDHLQSLDTILAKFNHELEELAEAENKWDEIPDIVYYSVLAHVQGGNLMLKQLRHLLKESGVSLEHAEAATLAKYRLRAAGEPKNIEKERAAILAAIQ